MKKIAIPHFEQVTDYSCGPACVRMVLGYYGIEADPSFLIQLLGATEDTGTSTDAFSRIAHVYELEYLSQEHATVDTIIHFIENDIPVIANVMKKVTSLSYMAMTTNSSISQIQHTAKMRLLHSKNS